MIEAGSLTVEAGLGPGQTPTVPCDRSLALYGGVGRLFCQKITARQETNRGMDLDRQLRWLSNTREAPFAPETRRPVGLARWAGPRSEASQKRRETPTAGIRALKSISWPAISPSRMASK